ncbi:NADH:quinone reductase (non-electrogenic), partial [Lecanoromycetidae sp. Uapishka_2]
MSSQRYERVSANDQDDHLENSPEHTTPQSTPSSPPPSFRSRASSPSSRHLLSSDPITTEAERTLADTFDDGSESDEDANNDGDGRQRLMRANTVQSDNEHRVVHDGTRPYLPRTVTRFPGATPIATNIVATRPQHGGAPFNSFSQNDGVFANLNAKPERGEEKEELPPSYEAAAADATPPYWETTILAPGHLTSSDEVYVDGLPVGSLFSFVWNGMISMSFQLVGFLLTYLLHTTHAAKNGSRAGLGITLVQYGFYMRSGAYKSTPSTSNPNDPAFAPPQDPNSHDFDPSKVSDSAAAAAAAAMSQASQQAAANSSSYVLSQQLSAKYQVLVISPRSYFVFTPLLNSTAVGTLEFRTALEPVRSRRKPHVEFLQGWADDVDFKSKTLTVEESVVDPEQGHALTGDRYDEETTGQVKSEKTARGKEGKRFSVTYDKLVVTVGCYSQTFGTPGVKENAFFMKDIGDARRIRKRVLECFEIASLPTTSDKLREQLLRFSIIGGGPTGMEFAAELSDLVREDMTKIYPALAPRVKIVVRDVAPTVLSMFDDKLSQYAMKTFRREGVEIQTESHIEELRTGLPFTDIEGNTMEEVADPHGCYTIKTKEEGEIGIGMCVWSTGNMMNPFVQKALSKTYGFPTNSAQITAGKQPEELQTTEWMIEKHPKTGAIIVDDRLRVQFHSKPPPQK